MKLTKNVRKVAVKGSKIFENKDVLEDLRLSATDEHVFEITTGNGRLLRTKPLEDSVIRAVNIKITSNSKSDRIEICADMGTEVHFGFELPTTESSLERLATVDYSPQFSQLVMLELAGLIGMASQDTRTKKELLKLSGLITGTSGTGKSFSVSVATHMFNLLSQDSQATLLSAYTTAESTKEELVGEPRVKKDSIELQAKPVLASYVINSVFDNVIPVIRIDEAFNSPVLLNTLHAFLDPSTNNTKISTSLGTPEFSVEGPVLVIATGNNLSAEVQGSYQTQSFGEIDSAVKARFNFLFETDEKIDRSQVVRAATMSVDAVLGKGTANGLYENLYKKFLELRESAVSTEPQSNEFDIKACLTRATEKMESLFTQENSKIMDFSKEGGPTFTARDGYLMAIEYLLYSRGLNYMKQLLTGTSMSQAELEKILSYLAASKTSRINDKAFNLMDPSTILPVYEWLVNYLQR